MTEPADQPLLTEQAPESKKPAKKRTVKAAASKATKATPAKTAKTAKPAKAEKAVKPAAKKTATKATTTKKKAAKAAVEETHPELPVVAETAPAAAVAPPAEMPAPIPPTAAPVPQPVAEEWSPSRSKAAAAAPSAPNPVAPTSPGPTQEAPPAPVVKQRPVYIPLAVARQMEEQARADGRTDVQIPVAMPADQAPRMERMERSDRPERGDRGDRRDRGNRHEREDRREFQDRGESAESMPRVELPPREDEIGEAEGLVEVSGKGFGFLRDAQRGFTQHPSDVFVTPELCRTYNLRDGQWVKGQTRRGNRGAQLFKITELNGDSPDLAPTLPAFDELTVISPLEKIRLETVPERYTTRIVDLMCPIGKGTRGLIVAPPRTGKTTLLQHIADAVVKNHPEVILIILLVDERPEEVTDIRRSVPSAQIMASSNDSDIKSHTRIAQLAMERAKRLVESGKDVFILLDSITRVGRAFNNAMTGGGRTGSGGLDTRALEIPRKIFASARNTEEAGSLTIIATALIETNSRMDEVIFQEFKGTGNMELVLDRKISDMRIYPAIDIFQSGTRRDELLIPADDLHKINVIRRGLAGHKPVEAIERLLFFAKKFPTNAQMLREIPG
jgi:transcription termination factor Rho